MLNQTKWIAFHVIYKTMSRFYLLQFGFTINNVLLLRIFCIDRKDNIHRVQRLSGRLSSEFYRGESQNLYFRRGPNRRTCWPTLLLLSKFNWLRDSKWSLEKSSFLESGFSEHWHMDSIWINQFMIIDLFLYMYIKLQC